jgi:hypothetical protein
MYTTPHFATIIYKYLQLRFSNPWCWTNLTDSKDTVAKMHNLFFPEL